MTNRKTRMKVNVSRNPKLIPKEFSYRVNHFLAKATQTCTYKEGIWMKETKVLHLLGETPTIYINAITEKEALDLWINAGPKYTGYFS